MRLRFGASNNQIINYATYLYMKREIIQAIENGNVPTLIYTPGAATSRKTNMSSQVCVEILQTTTGKTTQSIETVMTEPKLNNETEFIFVEACK